MQTPLRQPLRAVITRKAKACLHSGDQAALFAAAFLVAVGKPRVCYGAGDMLNVAACLQMRSLVCLLNDSIQSKKMLQ